MIKMAIGILLLLIVFVQVMYLERFTSYRRQWLAMLTMTLAIVIFFVLQNPLSSQDLTIKDYDRGYVEAMLAYNAEDYVTAKMYFDRLYLLKPSDQSYYREYADTLLTFNPHDSQLKTVMTALAAQPDRDPGWLLLFARYEQVLGHPQKAQEYYEEALGKLK